MSIVQETSAARRVERALRRHVEVSVVIPCLNEAGSIEACVRDAWKALADGGYAGEVIVVDNDSDDASAELAEAAGAHVVHEYRRGYDVVHTASFPYFSLLAAAAARPLGRYRLLVDWHELWTLDYWREYLGRAGGRAGWLVQRLCVAMPQEAFCFARLSERRLREEGFRGEITVLEGEYAGPLEPAEPQPAEPVVVFAGRHIPEKRVPALVSALAEVRRRLPDLRGEIYGDGPDRPEVLRRIAADGLDGDVEAPGFVDAGVVDAALERALCMVLPSRREGYGLVVVEASARGTPSIVVRDPDNAATELVEEGENGTVAASASAEDLAAAIERVHAAGSELRARTAAWFARNARRLSLESSLETVLARYGRSSDSR